MPQADERPLTVGKLIYSIAPAALLKKVGAKEVRRWSGLVGHSLDYTLNWS